MNLTEILYQPYIIAIIVALIFTFIVYLFLKKNNDKKDDKNKLYVKTLTITFSCSFIGFLGIIYGMKHLSNMKNIQMTGGSGGNNAISVADFSDKLNIADNDVDFDLLDN
jgi:predicted PurR-regulated permease PerM